EKRLEDALEKVGLSNAKFGALTHLVEAGEPLSLSECAARMTCVRSNITQLIDRLEADGLVRRVDDPADRRGVRA
ncbi:MAG: MarR family transcriptional regulator, partial [Betaproteobacteria bacterium]